MVVGMTKTCPCNIKKMFGCKNEKVPPKKIDIFLIFAQNIDCWYTLEPPQRGGSKEYPQSMFWSKIRKIVIPLHTPVLLYEPQRDKMYLRTF